MRAVAEVPSIWIRDRGERAGDYWEKATAGDAHARCWSMRTASAPAQVCVCGSGTMLLLVLSRVRWYGRAVVDAPQALWLLSGVSRVDFQGQF